MEAAISQRDEIIQQLTVQLQTAGETTPYSYIAQTQELAAQMQMMQAQLQNVSFSF